MRTLIIESDEIFGEIISRCLKSKDHRVDWLHDAKKIQALIMEGEYFDFVIMSTHIDNLCWKTWLGQFKANHPATPVIVFSASNYFAEAYNAGADMFISKFQWSRDKLFSCINSLESRRINNNASTSSVVSYKDIYLQLDSRQVVCRGENIKLNKSEFSILYQLLKQANKVVTREALIQTMYGFNEPSASNTLEVYISMLRKKLKIDYLVTLRGVGYALMDRYYHTS